jgi:hypothetical protein
MESRHFAQACMNSGAWAMKLARSDDLNFVWSHDALRGRGFVVCSVSRTEGGRRQERDDCQEPVGATAKAVRQWCKVLAVSFALWRLRDRKIGHQNSPASQHCKPPNE